MKNPAERSASLEKAAFSERLKRAIAEFDETLLSPTVLAREFNRRSRHSAIGVTAAQKWLSGDAIPQQEKLLVLANWLRVSAQWFRYGDGESQAISAGREQRRLDKLQSDFSALSERDKTLVEKMIGAMLKTAD